jgi:hypothetical protein
MPFQAALPTWLAINNVNSPSQSGQIDPLTNFPYAGGGLNLGDYFDLTNEEAAGASYLTNGLLYNGRYRYVQVDSGATAANVKTGTVGYMRAGSTVKNVAVLTQGSGQTVGTYQVAATVGSGGGSGAIIQVIVTSATAITVSVVNGGFGYVSPPTFTLATGGTPGTVQAQLNITPNIVTSADVALSGSVALAGNGPVRPVVFLNSIAPGNYGFIQELGVATVLDTASQTQTQGQFAIVESSTKAGLMTASGTTLTIYTIGQVIDATLTTPPVNTPFKILLNYAAGVIQD